MTPPSELIRPPSKAAVIFLRSTAGKQNGRRLSLVMAGVACLDPGKGLASATESYARSKAYATSATQIRPRHEYDGLDCNASAAWQIEFSRFSPCWLARTTARAFKRRVVRGSVAR